MMPQAIFFMLFLEGGAAVGRSCAAGGDNFLPSRGHERLVDRGICFGLDHGANNGVNNGWEQ